MLEIRQLAAGYPGGGRVLDGLDLSVPEGAFVAVLGRNGMGKTTLMRAICGLLRASEGTIGLGGEDITGLASYARAQRGIGYVPQGREIFGDFTVAENLTIGRIAKPGLSPAVPRHLLELFPILAERSRQRAGSLSGGQQQQLAIARALAGEPRLLLLDEPAEGIQPSIVQEIAQKLREIVDTTGLTVLMAEQNLAMVDGWADSLAFVDHGAIAESGVAAAGIRQDQSRLSKYLSI
ncbi:branched-chain amino acid transport system ATP-binding protein/urea transport system ATP-binding protein [Lutimaribacter pacificus]|uniref:Amino acid/amide ABC transporter ATP-binding protein 2, HAAT family n=1 Tax=Lutimaribacter pacificus TaxID=391948 RepID=A0A1H0M432_9RHOB|nr:ATP-binding cassette domain-containing protein [Lutimaribacter pacificus]SDO75183.1 branched-chain amino acid transport system ATP-binding protein/urea transport system ATP-binding protein [Lutimaribacter pacificus]SHK77549.1 amino acid/amide ABC transporter ATP-binding protein 2, HAAT family [Lutimaribacter pacificus]